MATRKDKAGARKRQQMDHDARCVNEFRNDVYQLLQTMPSIDDAIRIEEYAQWRQRRDEDQPDENPAEAAKQLARERLASLDTSGMSDETRQSVFERMQDELSNKLAELQTLMARMKTRMPGAKPDDIFRSIALADYADRFARTMLRMWAAAVPINAHSTVKLTKCGLPYGALSEEVMAPLRTLYEDANSGRFPHLAVAQELLTRHNRGLGGANMFNLPWGLHISFNGGNGQFVLKRASPSK